MFWRSRPVEHGICRGRALLVCCLGFKPCHSVGRSHAASRDKSLDAQRSRRRNGDNHVKVMALTGLDEQGDVVNDDVYPVRACLAIRSEPSGDHIRMHDAVEALALNRAREDDVGERRAIELTPGNHCIAERRDDVDEGRGTWFYHAPREHVVVDNAGAQLSKTARRSGLPGGDTARESNAQHVGIFTRLEWRGNFALFSAPLAWTSGRSAGTTTGARRRRLDDGRVSPRWGKQLVLVAGQLLAKRCEALVRGKRAL